MSWQWREDLWLSERMGILVVQLCGADTESILPALTPQMHRAFIYTRIPVQNMDILHTLTGLGFALVDTAITLECDPLPTLKPALTGIPHGYSVRHARPDDKDAIYTLARNTYHLTRFHQDSAIPQRVADTIQGDWAANFFSGGRGDFMLVGEKHGNIQGFLLALTPDAHTLVIDLIAVAREARGHGLGRTLLSVAQTHSRRPITRAGTQLANTAALAFYQRAGLLVRHASHTLHRHPDL